MAKIGATIHNIAWGKANGARWTANHHRTIRCTVANADPICKLDGGWKPFPGPQHRLPNNAYNHCNEGDVKMMEVQMRRS